MINREDMLELTRRMTPSRHCFDRIAGAYMDREGFVDGSFNIHFGKLSPSETSRNLKLAKAVPFFLFHGSYDIPLKASDKQRLWESEEIYDFLICVISPLIDEYEPGDPVWGFLYPAFSDRSADPYSIDIFNADPEYDNPVRKLFTR